MKEKWDVCIIGSGPGGYVCAIRAAQLGLKVVIVEKSAVGGVCLNVGCIPSKAMITAAHFLHRAKHDAPQMGFNIPKIDLNFKKLKSWKDSVCDRMSKGVNQLLSGNKVTLIKGEASFTDSKKLNVKISKKETVTITAKNFVVATGSTPIEIPGFSIDEKNVLSSSGALDLEKIPKSLVVVGGGYIGLEIGSYLQKLGTKVSVLEAGDVLLKSVADKDCVKVLQRSLKKSGIDLHLSAFAKSFKKQGKDLEVSFSQEGKTKKIKAEKILLTVGRKPRVNEMNLKKIGLLIADHGGLAVDSQCRTNITNIFAIGDISQPPLLAHKASYEGVVVAEVLAGKNSIYNPKVIPSVMFVSPEIASVGMSEAEAIQKGYEITVGSFPFAANGRAVSLMETEGLVKMVSEKSTHIILGVHIVGPEASQLISEASIAIEMGARVEDFTQTIHPHPTLSEPIMEAAEASLGHAIHIIQTPLRK
ncbi:MAG: dihydrolipoyl dehydrogenase [Bdellovibrionaceae bacterium]|nr:dihydrolipoyl dehydrogenase [Pseudobdellovibrionaceae bacterium]